MNTRREKGQRPDRRNLNKGKLLEESEKVGDALRRYAFRKKRTTNEANSNLRSRSPTGTGPKKAKVKGEGP